MYSTLKLFQHSKRRRICLNTLKKVFNLTRNFPSYDAQFNTQFNVCEIYRTRKQTESTFKSLGLSWTGDFESLKYFVADSLKMNGTWSQPGGDKKVFVAEDASNSIIWRKNKSILTIDGVKANQLKREVCRCICDYSSESSHASTEIEDLKQGQQSNEEAIQALSDTTSHMGALVSQFQDFMDKNKGIDGSAEYKNLHAGHVNKILDRDANDAEGNKSINTEQLTSITIKDWDNSLLPNITIATCDAETIGNKGQNMPTIDKLHTTNNGIIPINVNNEGECNVNEGETNDPIVLVNPLNLIESDNDELKHKDNVNPIVSAEVATSIKYDNKQVRNNNKTTFAEVVASSFAFNTCDTLEKSPTNKSQNNSQQIINDPPSDSADGFIGVDRRHNRVKKFLLSGIADNVKECQIVSYLKQRNITPTYISVFPSKRKGTISAKIHFRSADCSLVQQQKFWPQFVNCKTWQSEGEIRSNITHNGKYSTYV
jgi:hypothetical protein